MAKHKLFRSSRTTAEVEGYGVGYRSDYPIVNKQGEIISKNGARIGQAQFYNREASGQYEKRRALRLPAYDGGDSDDTPDRNGFKMSFDRDVRLLVFIGIFISVFVIMYMVMQMVFDAVSDAMMGLGLNIANLASFRIEASLTLGIVVAICVCVAASLWFFEEGDFDDSIFEA